MNAIYPSYVNFDPFIDVDALRALDGFIAERIEHHIAARQDSFFLNQHPLEADAPYAPGVREIWLRQTVPGTPYDYLDLDRPERWMDAPAAREFEPLMAFIATLPFAAIGRALIIYDDVGNSVPAHRDHVDEDACHEFIWMRTRFNKRFYMLEPSSGAKCYVASHSAWFDSVNQYHGADGCDALSFSIRVDGVFNEELRRQIPFDEAKGARAAVPALWASQVKADMTLSAARTGVPA
jgi:hypothetical protein